MCTVLVAALVLGASAAVAECLDGRVTYQAPEGCPDAQYFCDRLIDRAGARLALEPTSRVHVVVEASGVAGRFELIGPQGTLAARDFTSAAADGCRELVRTIASSLVAALGTTAEPPARTPAPMVQEPPTPTPPPVQVAPSPWVGEWLVGASLSVGWAPAATWGARVGVALREEGALSVGVDARLESSVVSAQLDPAVTVDTLVLAASPSVCVERSVFVLCADVVAGAARSSSEGLEGAGSAVGFTMAAGLRAGVRGRLLDGLAGALMAEAHAAVVATELRAGEVVLWRSPPVSAGLSLVLSGRIF